MDMVPGQEMEPLIVQITMGFNPIHINLEISYYEMNVDEPKGFALKDY